MLGSDILDGSEGDPKLVDDGDTLIDDLLENESNPTSKTLKTSTTKAPSRVTAASTMVRTSAKILKSIDSTADSGSDSSNTQKVQTKQNVVISNNNNDNSNNNNNKLLITSNVRDLTMNERMKIRSEKFGGNKMLIRAQRFGLSQSENTNTTSSQAPVQKNLVCIHSR